MENCMYHGRCFIYGVLASCELLYHEMSLSSKLFKWKKDVAKKHDIIDQNII